MDPLLAQRKQRYTLAYPTASSSLPSPSRPLALSPSHPLALSPSRPCPNSLARAALALPALTSVSPPRPPHRKPLPHFRCPPVPESVVLPKGSFAVAKMLDGVISQQESYDLEEVRVPTLASALP